MEKYSSKQLKGEFILTHSLRMQSITAGKAGRQEHWAAGYIVSTVRKQREMDAGAQLTFAFLFSLLPFSPWSDAVRAQDGSLKTFSLAHPEAYLLGNSKSSLTINIDHRTPSLWTRNLSEERCRKLGIAWRACSW